MRQKTPISSWIVVVFVHGKERGRGPENYRDRGSCSENYGERGTLPRVWESRDSIWMTRS